MANAFDRAAAREKEFHPKSTTGKTITAWTERAARLNSLSNAVAALVVSHKNLEARVAALEARPPQSFP